MLEAGGAESVDIVLLNAWGSDCAGTLTGWDTTTAQSRSFTRLGSRCSCSLPMAAVRCCC